MKSLALAASTQAPCIDDLFLGNDFAVESIPPNVLRRMQRADLLSNAPKVFRITMVDDTGDEEPMPPSDEVPGVRELRWVRENQSRLRPYEGQWIAVKGSSLIGVSKSTAELAKLAKERGIQNPFIMKINLGKLKDYAYAQG